MGTSNISEKQVPRGGNMIRGRLNVFLYFHTMYLQNCTLHIPIVMCLQKNRDLIVLRYRLPYTYWGGIWGLLTFNVAILSTLLILTVRESIEGHLLSF